MWCRLGRVPSMKFIELHACLGACAVPVPFGSHCRLPQKCREHEQEAVGAAGASGSGLAGRGGGDVPHAAPQVSKMAASWAASIAAPCTCSQWWQPTQRHIWLAFIHPGTPAPFLLLCCSIVQFMGLVALPPALITGGLLAAAACRAVLCHTTVPSPMPHLLCLPLRRVLRAWQPVRLPCSGSRAASLCSCAQLAPPADHGCGWGHRPAVPTPPRHHPPRRYAAGCTACRDVWGSELYTPTHNRHVLILLSVCRNR